MSKRKKYIPARNVILITEFDGETDKFERSYLLNNFEKGGFVFGTRETDLALARIGQVTTGKKYHVDVHDLSVTSVNLQNVI
ncbi:hypothetical protein [Enterococcus sp. AZ177]|uniref:hypothetical protein n=1 Tax=unclassified Enterococcus TaxID=2608891 RepID=UPI003D2FB7B3